MTRRNVIAMIGAFSPLVALPLSLPSAAFTEVGDATDLPPGQTTSGSGPLLGTFASLGDVDLYRIDIADAASFSAETSAGAGADTVLFLFDATGFAVAGNDDLSGGNSITEYFSRLIGVSGLVNGTYLLSISRWPYFPVSAGGQIFSIDLVNEELVPYQGVAYPTGPGESQVLTGWPNAFGTDDPLQPPYTIALTGVPEPDGNATCAVALGSLAAIGLAHTRARSGKLAT
jgi:hypothetical protein